jgi:parallel beta-helix repeat protein
VVDNIASDNGNDGIALDGESIGNVVAGNTANNNGGDGIIVDAEVDPAFGNLLDGNVANTNGSDGIHLAKGGHTVKGNGRRSSSARLMVRHSRRVTRRRPTRVWLWVGTPSRWSGCGRQCVGARGPHVGHHGAGRVSCAGGVDGGCGCVRGAVGCQHQPRERPAVAGQASEQQRAAQAGSLPDA